MCKKGKNLIGLVCLFAAFTLLSGCRGAANSNTLSQPVVATRIVTDDLGRKVTIPVKVTRVVSLAPNLTENIFAVGAGDRLVGVTTFCNYPEQAKEIAKIGDTMTPNMESIIALKPDVVFVSTASQIETFMSTLERNGIAVYVTNPASLDDVLEGLKKLGDLFGTGAFVTEFSKRLTVRMNLINMTLGTVPEHVEWDYPTQPRVSSKRVFVQISKEPLFTIGETSFLNQLIEYAGGKSVTSDLATAYPKLSKETASALDPEIIILSESDDNKEPNDAFKNSAAVKNGRVYKVNADLLSRPGPRLVDALEQIAKYLHPEKFK